MKGSIKKNFEALTPKQLAKYEDSLEVLNLMRHGLSLNKASNKVGVSPSTVKKYVGSVLRLKHHRFIPTKSDNLLRKIRTYEKGKEVHITVRGSKQSSLAGQYLGATGRIDQDTSALNSFKKKTIIDINGQIHRFETDITKIHSILERREDAEFFSIYSR